MFTRAQISTLDGARRLKQPEFISPQLATLVKDAPSGNEWLHELKFDGYRMLCHVNHSNVRFWSRNKKDWTAKFPHLVKAVKSLKITNAIFDGEVVIEEAGGITSFQKLQRSMGSSGDAGFVYEIFDLLYLDGYLITKVPLKQRKLLLRELFGSLKTGTVRYSDHVEGNGVAFYKQACAYGIEGIVSKLADAPYESTRNRNWLKIKCAKNQEFVIAGYTPSTKGLPGFGSLVLGVYENDQLVYAGRVGTGFSFKERIDLGKKLDKLARSFSPLAVTPKDPALRQVRWAKPKLIAEVTFTEWTSDGSIRHPSFQGLRQDKKPEEVVRELPENVVQSGSGKGKKR
jgi:bifunctional non-homologous end joining protein LigD